MDSSPDPSPIPSTSTLPPPLLPQDSILSSDVPKPKARQNPPGPMKLPPRLPISMAPIGSPDEPTSPSSQTSSHDTVGGGRVRRFPMRNVMYPGKLGTPLTEEVGEFGFNSGSSSRENVRSPGFRSPGSGKTFEGGILDEAASLRSPSLKSSNNDPFHMTKRFEHTVMEDGANFILTGREGVLSNCEEEPIHAPGAIQAFGVLIAFDEMPDGNLLVQQVSENSGFLLGLPPSALFKAPSLTDFFDADEADVLIESLSYLDERDADSDNTDTGPLNFQLSGFGVEGTSDSGPRSIEKAEWLVHCTLHRPDRSKYPSRAILEMELVEDAINPLTTKRDEVYVDEEKGGMRSEGVTDPTEEDLRQSTVSLVKPLRALARFKNKSGKANRTSETDVVALLSQINEQLAKAEDLAVFLKTTAGVFKELTDFDRVMVYQFDESWNGRVVAEQVDWTRTKDLFRGLNFPASDIPAQARELYRLNKVRLLYDRDQPTARLCCRTLEEVQSPLNMTHCCLRAMSPIHVKYLANMGVRSSMSISITAFGDLWGLVALHHYGRHGQRVSFPVRQLSKLLGDAISRNIERLSYAKRLHARKLINTAPTIASPSGYIVAKAEDLLTLFDADYGVLSIGDEAKILGVLDNSQELLAVLEYLRVKCFTTLKASQDIKKDFPDIQYPLGFEVIAGLLSVPLSSEGKDFIVFFRRGQLKDVHWAGNPYVNKKHKVFGEVSQVLEPRKSFKIWSETVVGRCRAWTDEQLETAGVLCLVYGKFIDVWRQKETALAANQLTNLLLANASHEVRTPLNAIINYLELALDGPVDGEVREHLSKSHAASRSLIHVINDLLDLTRTEKGNDLFLQDPFDLPSTISEALSVHKAEALRRGLTLDVVENPGGTPPTVLGDRGKIRQIVANVVANAVKHTTAGGIMVEWGELSDAEDEVVDALENRSDSIRIAISISDTGCGISDARLESIFREFEQVSTVGDEEHQRSRSALGLGLAVVARIVRNLGGQLRVESKEGAGSKFTFVIPFRLPSADDYSSRGSAQADALMDISRSGTHSSHTIHSAEGSSNWLRSQLSARSDPPIRSNSNGSVRSLGSSRSEIDSLISAISASHMDSNSAAASLLASRKKKHRVSRTLAVQLNQQLKSGKDNGLLRPSDALSPIESEPASPVLKGPTSYPFSDFPAISRGDEVAHSSSFTSSMSRRSSIRSIPMHISEYRAPEDTSPKVDRLPSMRVLVVEDEPINRMIIEKRLSKDGHIVVTAEHGGDALRLLEEDPHFDLVLMDLQMPILNGFETAACIREMEAAANKSLCPSRPSTKLNGRLPILAVSASLHERQRDTIANVGIDGWILKPVDFKRLASLMRGTIDLAARIDDIYRPGAWERGGWLEMPGLDSTRRYS